ncbi:(R)-mandelonitrile lyase [Marinobacter oulmenensis]|uniref:Quercetin dioxygenase-like cupin family protein n=1 Tax=Marinobacter oulmenensis TaxID=643747 RepID=A0A840UH83_9GAMM|nr:cupin domain-containing protein [Marinobacter oulmenensis]MBB5320516.1 quercetin dioxygenase-like cupin family protein [Marinobacter oulmenensis]
MPKTSILKTTLFSLATLTAGSAIADSDATGQVHYPEGSLDSFAGPADLFTGDVQVDIVFPSNDVAHYSGAYVTFQPGAHTAWHSHPAGQHMIVTDGTALTGTRDGKVVEFLEGEAVWCPPELDHWHGATPDEAVTHFVVTAAKDGENVIWKDKLTAEEYASATE